MRLQPGVDQFQNAKRVGLATQVGGRESVSLVHAHREHADVAQVAERAPHRVLVPHVFAVRDVPAVESGQVRDHLDRWRAADRQQQVQHAAAAAAIRPTTAAAGAHFVFDLVRALPFQLAQVDDGAAGIRNGVKTNATAAFHDVVGESYY